MAFSNRVRHDELTVQFTDEQVLQVATMLDVTPQHIQTVIDAMNDALLSDPVGTIRRSPGGDWLAVRVPNLDSPYETMCVTGRGGSCCSLTENILGWNIVWQPGTQDRVPSGRSR